MINPQKISKAFKPAAIPKTPKGSAGYDNARENIDPHVKTKTVSLPLTTGSILFIDGSGSIKQANADLFWDDTNKRLGIGRTNPTAKLDIAGGATSNLLSFYNTDGFELGTFSLAANDLILTMENSDAVDKIQLHTDGDTYFNGGNVGIGTTTLERPLTVKNGIQVRESDDGNKGVEIVADTDEGFVDIYSNNVLKTRLQGDGDNFFIGGNIGIGATSPSYPLQINYNGNVNTPGFTVRATGTGANDDCFMCFQRDNTSSGWSVGIDSSTNDFCIGDGLGGLDTAEFVIEKTTGNVGIGTTTPSQPLSVQEKSCMTAIGGFAVKLTNKTGANSVAGQLVKADTATDDAFILAAAGDVECIGVVLDSGVADAAEAWVVVAGIADVAFDDNVAATRGDWVSTGVLAGYAATAASPAAAPTHFEEIGHCIESVAAGGAGTHILARCVLHFN